MKYQNITICILILQGHFYRHQETTGKKVIRVSWSEVNDSTSGVFTRDKKNGNKKMILNLNKINKFVNYEHFKMESINNVINPISFDLKDAFF